MHCNLLLLLSSTTTWSALFVAEDWWQWSRVWSLYRDAVVASDSSLIETSCTAQEARPAKVCLNFTRSPRPSNWQHLSCDGCLEEDYQNCSVLYCMSSSHKWTTAHLFRFFCVFLHVFRNWCLFFCLFEFRRGFVCVFSCFSCREFGCRYQCK